jgi:hypothetical protein
MAAIFDRTAIFGAKNPIKHEDGRWRLDSLERAPPSLVEAQYPQVQRRGDTMKMLSIAVSAFSLCSCMAFAESGRVTCTGMLVPLELSPKADWPLTVIYDAQVYTCLVDWGRAGHDPLRGSGCKPGSDCRVIGTYKRKIGQTYFIDSVLALCSRDDPLASENCKF